ncbi:MAG: HAD-IIIA family hydrolase [Candidatus Omnitrophica bacterium]|nr:HAD-IIIA family hydrolase [Candidatus Omnitrophota bacterium]
MTVEDRAKRIKLLLLDVDGVLTDGKITYDTSGAELKSFNVLDGVGITVAVSNGIKVVLISARGSSILKRRARELKITRLCQNVKNKSMVYQKLLRKYRITPDEVCYVGDDLPDLSVIRQTGLSAAVPDAAEDVRNAAHYITRRKGGEGAVREIVELIMKVQGKWENVIKCYL